MSETVHYKGVLSPVVKLKGESLEEQCKRLLNNKELPSYCESYQEMLTDEFYQEYVIYDDIVYQVEKQEMDDDDDIFITTKGKKGTFNFEVRYYNGGCGFDEAIEEAMKNLS